MKKRLLAAILAGMVLVSAISFSVYADSGPSAEQEEAAEGLSPVSAAGADAVKAVLGDGIDESIDSTVKPVEEILKSSPEDAGIMQMAALKAAENEDFKGGKAVDFLPSSSESLAMARISTLKYVKMYDGNGDWDSSVESGGDGSTYDLCGNDRSDSNGFVRTNDDVTYVLAYSAALGEKQEESFTTVKGVRMYVKYVLPVTAAQAVFDTEAMNWMENVKITENPDGSQTLTGSRLLPDTAGDTDSYSVPGAGTLNCVIHVRQMNTGSTFAPDFSAWVDNGSNQDAPPYAKSAAADQVTVTCGPQIRIHVGRIAILNTKSRWENAYMFDGGTQEIYGRLAAFRFSAELGKENGNIKGADVLAEGSEISLHIVAASTADSTAQGCRMGIFDVKTKGKDSGGSISSGYFGHDFSAEDVLKPLGITYAAEENRYGYISGVSGVGVRDDSGDTKKSIQYYYTVKLKGFQTRVPSSNPEQNRVSEGVIVFQQQELNGINDAIAETKIPDGIYEIASAANRNYVLDVKAASLQDGANVQLYSSNHSAAQKYYIEQYGEPGCYSIKNLNSGKSVEAAEGKTVSGTNVRQWTWNSSGAQIWKIVQDADGSTVFRLFNKNTIQSGKPYAMQPAGGTAADGANIELGGNSFYQKFVLRESDYNSGDSKNLNYHILFTVDSADAETTALKKEIHQGAVASLVNSINSGSNYTTIMTLRNSAGTGFLTTTFSSVDGRIPFGSSFLAHYSQVYLRSDPVNMLGAETGVQKAYIVGIWDSKVFQLATESAEDVTLDLPDTGTAGEIAYMVKNDGTPWKSEDEMRTANLSFEEAKKPDVRYYASLAEAKEHGVICGIRAAFSKMNLVAQKDYSSAMKVKLKVMTADPSVVGKGYPFMVGGRVYTLDSGGKDSLLVEHGIVSRDYKKTEFSNTGVVLSIPEQDTSDRGNTLYITGTVCGISKVFAGSGGNVQSFCTASGQTRAIYKIKPTAVSISGDVITGCTAGVTDMTPTGMVLKKLYFGTDDFQTDGSFGGYGGSPSGSSELTPDGSSHNLGDLSGIYGRDIPGTYSCSTTQSADGQQGYEVIFSGFSSAFSLPVIYAVYDIDSSKVANGAVIKNTAKIEGSGMTAEASASLRISKLKALEIRKKVDKETIRNNENLTWSIELSDNSYKDESFQIMDVLPDKKNDTLLSGTLSYTVCAMSCSAKAADQSDYDGNLKMYCDGNVYTGGDMKGVKTVALSGTAAAGGKVIWNITVQLSGGRAKDYILNHASVLWDSDDDGIPDGNDTALTSNYVRTDIKEMGEAKVYKSVSRISNAIGEKHTWTLTSVIPEGIDDAGGTFRFSDPMDTEQQRLDYEGNLQVRISDGSITADKPQEGEEKMILSPETDYTVSALQLGAAGQTLVLELTEAGRSKAARCAGKLIQVLFDTSLNQRAAAGIHIPNNAELEYGDTGNIKRTANPLTPYVYTGEVRVLKKDQETGKTLPDTIFGIYSPEGAKLGCLTAGSDGVVIFTGLRDGKYLLKEEKAPSGYHLQADSVQVTVTEGEAEGGTVIFTDAKNSQKAVLNAGGGGTGGFIFIGAAFLVLSGLTFLKRFARVSVSS